MANNEEIMIRVQGLKKQYRIGQIGGGTLRGDLQSWWARKRGKEDPNTKIGTDQRLIGQTFMALNGLDFEVKKGEAVGIIGSNGAGKSTLLKILTHVTAPTEGVVDMYGRVASMLEVGTGFHPEMTGRENVYLNGAILGMTKAEIDAKMDDIIEFSEVKDFIDTPVKRYSSGMYVKLAFSVAAHLDSEIMIMDEVLAVGDIKFQQKCLTKMKEAATQDGRTVLYVSHNMSTIRQLCDRCIVLNQGRIVFDGDVEKAIAIYSGNDSSELPLYYDLQNAPRPSPSHGQIMHIESCRFEGTEKASFACGQDVDFELVFKANKDIEGLRLYYVLCAEDGAVVGLAQTFEPIADVKRGERYKVEFAMGTSELANGKYSLQLDLYSSDENNRHLSYDHPLSSIDFELIDYEPKGLVWDSQYYGHVKIGPLTTRNVEVLHENRQD